MGTMVKREKYDTIKRKATQWRLKALEALEEVERLRIENDKLKSVETTEELEHLRSENKELETEIIGLQKQVSKSGFEQERILLRKNGEIDRLRVALEDYKERYKEVREDNRELRKGVRAVRG